MIRTIALASTILIPVIAVAQTMSSSTTSQTLPGTAQSSLSQKQPTEQELQAQKRAQKFDEAAAFLNRWSRDSANIAGDANDLKLHWDALLVAQAQAEVELASARKDVEAANGRVAEAIKRENEANKLAQIRADDLVKVRAQLQQAQQQLAKASQTPQVPPWCHAGGGDCGGGPPTSPKPQR